MDHRLPGSSVHVILQARILEGVFPTQGTNPCLLHLLHWQTSSLPLAAPKKLPRGWVINIWIRGEHDWTPNISPVNGDHNIIVVVAKRLKEVWSAVGQGNVCLVGMGMCLCVAWMGSSPREQGPGQDSPCECPTQVSRTLTRAGQWWWGQKAGEKNMMADASGLYKVWEWTSLGAQWLRLCAPSAGDAGSIPGQGTRARIWQLKKLSATTKTWAAK